MFCAKAAIPGVHWFVDLVIFSESDGKFQMPAKSGFNNFLKC